MSGVELWWIGQSGFRLRDPAGGKVLFIDPFISDSPDRSWPAPVGPEDLAHADVVLCTHDHMDHLDRPALKAAAAIAEACFTLVVPAPIVDDVLALGLPRERIVGAQPGEQLTVAGVAVRPVPARHGQHASDAYSFGQELSNGLVRYLGYVVEIGGARVYHAGDTIPYDGQIETLQPFHVHLALLPINGRDYFRETEQNVVGNMSPREAVRVAADIGAQVLVPMHWEMFPRNPGFPGEVMSYAARHAPQLTILVFGRGEKVTYLAREDVTTD